MSIFSVPPNTWRVTVIFLYMASNISLTILNRMIFIRTNFRFPITLTAFHALCGFFFSGVALGLPRQEIFVLQKIKRQDFSKVFLQALLFALDISLNNSSLVFISVALNQIIRSCTPLLAAMFAICVTRKTYSPRYWGCLVLLCLGVGLSTFKNPDFNIPGFILVVLATLVGGFMVVFADKLLKGDKTVDSLNLTFYTSPLIFLFLLPFAIWWEGTEALRFFFSNEERFFEITLGTGMLAWFYNVFHYLLIVVTNGVHSSVLGNFKTVFLIAISIAIFHTPLEVVNVLGMAVTVVAYCLISLLERRERFKQDGYTQQQPLLIDELPSITQDDISFANVDESGQVLMMEEQATALSIVKWDPESVTPS